MEHNELSRLIAAAAGKIPFDKAFVNMRLVDVYCETVISNAVIGVCGGVIASVCPDFNFRAAEIIDCGNMYAAPSFIDSHMHIESSRLTPFAYAEGAVPHGTGAVFTDPMQTVEILGEKGAEGFCAMLDKLPMHSFIQFPSSIPPVRGLETTGADLSPEATAALIEKYKAVSLGEVNCRSLSSAETQEKLILARERSLLINGHCPAMTHDELCAAAAAGIADDHECENGHELVTRLRAGISVMIREGTSEPDSTALLEKIIRSRLPTDSVMFCTDDKTADDIRRNGCIDNIVRIAIKCGMNPVKAIKTATLNAARHFGLERRIGSCTPGRYADLVLFRELSRPEICKVYFKGELVAEDGELTSRARPSVRIPDSLRGSVRIPPDLSERSLSADIPDNCKALTAVVMSMSGDSLLVRKSETCLKAKGGFVLPDTKRDILPISVVERYGSGGNVGCGFIHGLEIKRGAVASSTSQAGGNIVVSGADYGDMLRAVKAVAEAGGGSCVCIDGKVEALHRLPAAGIMGEGHIEDELSEAKKFNECLKYTGSKNDFLMTMLTVSLCPTIPEIGLTDMGYIDAAANCPIPSVYDFVLE